jgi:hypothetical protein
MRGPLAVLAVVAVAALAAPVAVADSPVHVNGGGQGTFGINLDGSIDPDIDGSHFGIGVVLAGSSVRGHFECLMAGNADILGLPLMAVEGTVTSGTASAGTASIAGIATVNLGNGVIFRDVPFQVVLNAGGPGVGQLQLTVIGAFDGVPGDTAVGNNNYDLPPETVATGQISIR